MALTHYDSYTKQFFTKEGLRIDLSGGGEMWNTESGTGNRNKNRNWITGIGTLMGRRTYIKTGTTFTLIYFNLDLILILYLRKIRRKGL